MLLSPITNRIVKEVSALSRSGVSREQGLFIAEGIKVVKELLTSGLAIQMVVLQRGFDTGNLSLPNGVSCFEASAADFRKLSSLTTPAGILAVASRPGYPLPAAPKAGEWFLCLDRISDPGNLGTIIRTAEWFGVKDLICEPGTADAFSSKVVQSAMGSVFRTRLHYTSLYDFIQSNSVGKLQVLAATAAGKPCREVNISDRGLLIIGSESHGISDSLLDLASDPIAIARQGGSITESLNAAVSCGILLHTILTK